MNKKPLFFLVLSAAVMLLLSSGLFLMGTWLLFEMGEPVFLLYAGIYLAMGMGAMLVSRFLTVRSEAHG